MLLAVAVAHRQSALEETGVPIGNHHIRTAVGVHARDPLTRIIPNNNVNPHAVIPPDPHPLRHHRLHGANAAPETRTNHGTQPALVLVPVPVPGVETVSRVGCLISNHWQRIDVIAHARLLC